MGFVNKTKGTHKQFKDNHERSLAKINKTKGIPTNNRLHSENSKWVGD